MEKEKQRHHEAESKYMISRHSRVRMENEQQRRSPRGRKQIQPILSRRRQVTMEKEQRHHDADSKYN